MVVLDMKVSKYFRVLNMNIVIYVLGYYFKYL